MSEYRDTLDRELERLSPTRIPFDELVRRRDRKRRNERLRAALLGLAIAIMIIGSLSIGAIRSAPAPADDPTPSGLGIFADVRGWIAYGHQSNIWAMDPANLDADPIVLDPNRGVPLDWSSDGSKLLILRYEGGPSLVVLNGDGTETVLAAERSIWMWGGGSFTPDGSHVVYAARVPGKDWKTGIYVVDAGGGTPRLLYTARVAMLRSSASDRPEPQPFQMAVYSPAVSPDGSQIAYIEGMGDWANSLWVMNADGTHRRQILGEKEGIDDTSPLQWSPDGTRLAFVAFPSVGGIYVVNVDGSGLALATDEFRSGPYWSPDGTRIAFTARGGSLATVRPDGTQVRDFGVGRAGPWNPLDEQH